MKKQKKLAKAHNSLNCNWLAWVLESAQDISLLLGGSSDFYKNSGALGLIDSLGNEVLPESYDVIWQHDQLFITRKGNLNEQRQCKTKSDL